MAALEALRKRGVENGVRGLEYVDDAYIRKREPHVRCHGALISPDSGIVDAEAYVKALLRAGEDEGVIFLPGTRLMNAEWGFDGIRLHTERETIVARQVVNAAGLYADDVSSMMEGERFTIYPVRGEYAELTPARRSLVKALVYPLPHGHGLGVHLVRTPGGAVWLGPTVKYQERKDDYESDRLPVEEFVEPARRLIPEIALADLRLSGSGIRAKLHPASESFADFLIRRDRNNTALVQAAGIDSPGLTSSLAIGKLVSEIVADFD
jgi:glycerol-3-phosphate dehydrogenase